ncbi:MULTISPECIES: hypothetical protein [unclassified Ensifer]|uniref:hypothetical protein n=1 Tax=unclassified Ensifer TaxID=2633371 RepID=UPI000812CB33|nr:MULTISPECIES: hypothetical protein [unclassified Ensifer]OCP21884.1 hypothetical protein BC361_25280 [Ensifer sp. LC54]OCP23336.1 hypothetical protein BC363_25485 [Ensifer sp. LC384]
MLKALISPYLGWIYGAVAVAAVAGAIFTYHAIYERGWDARGVVAEQEKEAMRQANDRAIAAAEKGLREDIAGLVLEKKRLENENARLDAEADQDSDAGACGLNRNSVQRLNAVR